MVEILVNLSNEGARHERYGETSSPCLPAPLLEQPYNLPQSIEIVHEKDDNRFIKYKHRPVYPRDEHLSSLLSAYTNGIFTDDVTFISITDGNVPVIDTFNCADQFAIGPRLELLHKYHGVGSSMLWLLSMSPINFMLPDWIDRYFMELCEELGRCGDKDKSTRRSGLLPEWAYDYERINDVPKGLPYSLSKIVEDCLSHVSGSMGHESGEECVGSWPIATCSWYGFEPLVDKTSVRFASQQDYDPSYRLDFLSDCPDMGQASDPTRMVLDHLMIYQQEYVHSTCMPLLHDATEIEDYLYSFGPFAKLLNYLSHDRINH